jgi:hypothetical protein
MRCGLRDMDGKLFLETICVIVDVEVRTCRECHVGNEISQALQKK